MLEKHLPYNVTLYGVLLSGRCGIKNAGPHVLNEMNVFQLGIQLKAMCHLKLAVEMLIPAEFMRMFYFWEYLHLCTNA